MAQLSQLPRLALIKCLPAFAVGDYLSCCSFILTVFQFENQCAMSPVIEIQAFFSGKNDNFCFLISDFCFLICPCLFFFFLLCFVLFFKLIVPITRLWVSLFHRNSSRWVWMSRRLENTPWSMENTQHFGRYSSFFNWNIAIITIYWLLNDSTNGKFWRWSNSI